MTEHRILTLWQPWAGLMAAGLKTIETRSWSTKFRGPIAIHAAKRAVDLRTVAAFGDLVDRIDTGLWQQCHATKASFRALGAIVAVGNLVDVVPTTSLIDLSDLEAGLGDYSRGRFGWVFEDIVALPEPISFRGGQGLRRLDAATTRSIAWRTSP